MNNLLLKSYRTLQLGISYKLRLLKPLNPPYQCSIESTNRCNFKCSFCPQSDPNHIYTRPQGNLTKSNFFNFLKKVKDISSGNLNISIGLDGESLMNKHFPEFIRMANQEGFFPRFSSNGRLLLPNVIDMLSRYNFLASIDFSGEEEVFENIRGRKGDYKVVLNNLRYLVDKAMINRGINIEIVDITSFAKNNKDISLTKMRSLFPKNLPSNIVFFHREFHNFGGYLQHLTKKGSNYKLCPYPWTSFPVTWDGNVVACCRDTEGKTILGNIFNQSILDIWWGRKYREMRRCLVERRPQDIEACKKCDLPWGGGSRWNIHYILSSLLRR